MQANCPICLEDVGTTNCVITECGHSFHSSCLMKNVAYNGFGCPYCRAAMANDPDEDETDDSDETEDYEDYLLRGFRFFHNNLNEEEHDMDDRVDELAIERPDIKPTTEYISGKLIESGITIEHFVKAMLKDVNEYENEEDEYDELDDQLFEKIRGIIINYQVANS